MNAWDIFKQTTEKEHLISDGDRILIAISGGPDSVCLTHCLWRLRKTRDITLAMAYVHHGLRSQADAEERFVRRLGTQLDIPVEICRIAVRSHAYTEKLSLETAGRELRYTALLQAACRQGCNKIATAHNANDNAETVIMWLLRGTGSEGLAGIPLRRSYNEHIEKSINLGSKKRSKSSSELIRPLLAITRKKIEQYLQQQRLPFYIDKSNRNIAFSRNRIRHTMIPLFEAYNPRAIEHIYSLSRNIAQENAVLEKIIQQELTNCATVKKSKIMLDFQRFFEYNEAIQMRIILALLPERRERVHIERIREWITGTSTASSYLLSQHYRITRTKRYIIFPTATGSHASSS